MDRQIGNLRDDDWKQVRLGLQKMDVADVGDHRPFGGHTSYRLVISRIKRDDAQTDMFSGQPYIYRAILTNDTDTPNEDIVGFTTNEGTVNGFSMC